MSLRPSAAPGHGADAGDVDGLVLQGVAGPGEAGRVPLQDRHPQGDGDGLQAGRALHALAGVAGVAVGLVDDPGDPVQVNVLPVEGIR